MAISVDRIHGVAGGLAIKAPVRVATTANITLSGLQTIDGITLVDQDRVLVKNQTDAVDNGIWVATTSSWSRALDFNGALDVVQGTLVNVVEGTVAANTVWSLTTANPITLGTSSLSFTLFSVLGSPGGARVVTSIAALRNLDKTLNVQAFVTGYYAQGDGGGGAYWLDSNDTTSADNGGTIIVATDGGRWKLQVIKSVTVKQFGAKGDGTTNDTTSITNARTAAIASDLELVFTAGVYAWTGVNLAASSFTVRADGEVELKNTGAGVALNLDAGTSANFYNFRMLGNFIISGNASSTTGIFMRAVHHSELDLRVKNVPGTAFDVKFMVLTKARLICSVNEQAFTITPNKGLSVDKRNSGEFTAACDFDVTIEGVGGIGVDLVEAQGCAFRGTSEGNTSLGIRDAAACRYNTWNEFWMEANTGGDGELYGVGNRLNNCRALSTAVTNNIELVTARGTVFSGGFIRCVNRQGTSADTLFENAATSDNASLGFKGAGTYRLINCWKEDINGALTSRYADVLGNFGTFTPTIVGTGGTAAHTYSAQVGYYQIMGGRLFGEILVGITTKDAGMTGNVSIGGLPFASNADSNRISAVSFADYTLITTTAARPHLTGRILANASAIGLFMNGPAAGPVAVASADIVNGSVLTLAFNYPLPA